MSWDGIFYDKYKIAHTDGTPLKGKRYFVLRLDSDDPVEAARVQTAMRAYEKKPRNCDVGKAKEQSRRFDKVCSFRFTGNCAGCQNPLDNSAANGVSDCALFWAQMPYEANEKGEVDDSNG